MEAEYRILQITTADPTEALTQLAINVNKSMDEGFYPIGGPSVFETKSEFPQWHAIQSVLRERQS